MRAPLTEIATRHGTDKWAGHRYAQHYDRHFGPFRDRPISILEIGIGGYADPRAGGQSLRMWKEYFPHARVYGLDIHDKSSLDEDRIKTVTGSQDDPACLQRLLDLSGGFDLIVDDGSHVSAHVIAAFSYLFPRLNADGIYAIEDLETSYWPSFGGSSELDGRSPTAINHLKSLVDGLHFEELDRPGYQPTYTDRHVTSLHFYHNLCFIQKGLNDEGSIWVKNNILDPRIR